jgi:hypothetical protein
MTFHRGIHEVGGGGVQEFSTYAEKWVENLSVMKELQGQIETKGD